MSNHKAGSSILNNPFYLFIYTLEKRKEIHDDDDERERPTLIIE